MSGPTFHVDQKTLTVAGKLCGASYINEKYEHKLLKKLASETYLEKNGKTLRSIVQATVPRFENFQKRRIDITNGRAETIRVYIDDLKENRKKLFYANILELER